MRANSFHPSRQRLFTPRTYGTLLPCKTPHRSWSLPSPSPDLQRLLPVHLPPGLLQAGKTWVISPGGGGGAGEEVEKVKRGRGAARRRRVEQSHFEGACRLQRACWGVAHGWLSPDTAGSANEKGRCRG